MASGGNSEGGSGDDDSYRLILRAPNQRFADFEMKISTEASIRELKEKLSLSYHGNPDVRTQKLIYCGKLLNDGQKLSLILNADESSHVLHFICLTRCPDLPDEKPAQQPQAAASDAGGSQLRFRYSSINANQAAATGQQGASSSSQPATTTPPSSHHYVAAASQSSWVDQRQAYESYMLSYTQMLHQNYFNYMQQYAAHMVMTQQPMMVGGMAAGFMAQQQQPAAQTPPPVVQPQQQAAEPEQRQRPEPAAAPQQEAAGGMFDDEAEGLIDLGGGGNAGAGGGRDMLHYGYVFIRCAFLFILFYFHSSITRFLLIGCAIAALIGMKMLMKTLADRRRGNQREERRRQMRVVDEEEEVVVEEVEDEQTTETDRSGQAAETNEEAGESSQADQAARQQPPPAIPFHQTIFTAFASFLTSLFPDGANDEVAAAAN